MNSNQRLHTVLLTLWDVARSNPNYNRKLWGELQVQLSQLETRNNLLCALMADLLHCTDDAGNVMWEEATAHSPPEGYAIKFMQEELERVKRPQMPKPSPVIPVNQDGVATVFDGPSSNTFNPVADRASDDLITPVGRPNPLPLNANDEYDERDESDDEEDHLGFEFDFSNSEDSSE